MNKEALIEKIETESNGVIKVNEIKKGDIEYIF